MSHESPKKEYREGCCTHVTPRKTPMNKNASAPDIFSLRIQRRRPVSWDIAPRPSLFPPSLIKASVDGSRRAPESFIKLHSDSLAGLLSSSAGRSHSISESNSNHVSKIA